MRVLSGYATAHNVKKVEKENKVKSTRILCLENIRDVSCDSRIQMTPTMTEDWKYNDPIK